MKFMVIVKASKDSEAGVMPDTKLLAGEGLHPSSKGVRVRFSGSQRTVIDGPVSGTTVYDSRRHPWVQLPPGTRKFDKDPA